MTTAALPPPDADVPTATPASRWRAGPSPTPPRGAADRVRPAQRQAARALALAASFVAAAAIAAVVRHDTGRWLPLHLFLAGGLLLAISGVSVLLAATGAAVTANLSAGPVRVRRRAAAEALGLGR